MRKTLGMKREAWTNLRAGNIHVDELRSVGISMVVLYFVVEQLKRGCGRFLDLNTP